MKAVKIIKNNNEVEMGCLIQKQEEGAQIMYFLPEEDFLSAKDSGKEAAKQQKVDQAFLGNCQKVVIFENYSAISDEKGTKGEETSLIDSFKELNTHFNTDKFTTYKEEQRNKEREKRKKSEEVDSSSGTVIDENNFNGEEVQLQTAFFFWDGARSRLRLSSMVSTDSDASSDEEHSFQNMPQEFFYFDSSTESLSEKTELSVDNLVTELEQLKTRYAKEKNGKSYRPDKLQAIKIFFEQLELMESADIESIKGIFTEMQKVLQQDGPLHRHPWMFGQERSQGFNSLVKNKNSALGQMFDSVKGFKMTVQQNGENEQSEQQHAGCFTFLKRFSAK